MLKIGWSAFATNTKTGKRVYLTGHTTANKRVPARHYEEKIRRDLAAEGFRNATIHLTHHQG
ncbi:hypothetical protein QIS99_28870 [Streptomyces sp. B-S-A8]|uniref:Uncharacterized protein n=1 Tax=Streptomyces solicavernae TaxID=3043614 RepID=A0ABT6S171_9ACTN|nr:hypothetical protein [Streptomyces sp. B-S-A8]MDI3390174.1 hypothetical protein [Streptomyces sp. B-S-A8]